MLTELLEVQVARGYSLGMDEVARLLNEMVQTGILTNYAMFGAVAQMRYTEAVVTLDADVLVAVPNPEALIGVRIRDGD